MELHPIIPRNKWFGRDIESFAQMNEQSIRAWINVAKKLVRENKRKQIKEQQHSITKKFQDLHLQPNDQHHQFQINLQKQRTNLL